MNKIKVIISTGIGPLHLISSAIHLSKLTDLKVIQSWIPRNTDGWFVKVLSKLINHKHLARGLKKRTPKELNGRNFSCTFPDFFLWGLNLFSGIFRFPSKKNIAGWGWKIYGKHSRKYINDANIFHVRSGAGQGGAILKAKTLGMKIVVDHSIAHPAYMDKHLKMEYQKYRVNFDLGMDSPLFQYTIKDAGLADIILVNSFFVKETFIEQGFDSDKLKVVYLGVRNDFMGLKKDYQAKQKIKLLFTGGFGFRKGAEYLLKALQILEKENFAFEMKIVGDYREAMPLLEKYPIENIEMVGFVPQEELKQYLSEADIYVFPSLSEGCASSGMEALAVGLPVIATKESGFPINDGEDGLLIPSKDHLAIAEAIRLLANDEHKRTVLGQNAANKIRTQYTWQHYATNVESIYKEILYN